MECKKSLYEIRQQPGVECKNWKSFIVPSCLCKNWFVRIISSGKTAANSNSTETETKLEAKDKVEVEVEVGGGDQLTNFICWQDHKFISRRRQLLEKYVKLENVDSADDVFYLLPAESVASEQVRLGNRVLPILH